MITASTKIKQNLFSDVKTIYFLKVIQDEKLRNAEEENHDLQRSNLIIFGVKETNQYGEFAKDLF